ncbi:MAG: hypothetical protein AAFQ66_18245 [Pseudomonadota bacterium]
MKRWVAIAAVALSMLSSPSLAGTVTLQQTYGNLFGNTPEERLRRVVEVTYGATPIKAWAGAFRISEAAGEDFLAFCVELAEYLKLPFTYTKTLALFDAATTDRVAQLYDSAFTQVTNSDAAAAFQVALWEIVTDQGTAPDLDSGTFVLNSGGAVRNVAESFLSGLSSGNSSAYQLTFYSAPGSQDVVTGQLSLIQPIAAIPLPGTGVLLIGAIGAAALVGRAKRRRA